MAASVQISLVTATTGPARKRQVLPTVDSAVVASADWAAADHADADALAGEPNQYWRIVATGGNVYAAFGADPDADADPRVLILEGVPEHFGVTVTGEKIALADVA